MELTEVDTVIMVDMEWIHSEFTFKHFIWFKAVLLFAVMWHFCLTTVDNPFFSMQQQYMQQQYMMNPQMMQGYGRPYSPFQMAAKKS